MLKNFSFFEVNEAHVDLLISSFKKVHYKGRKVNIEVSDKAPSSSQRPHRRSGGGRPSGSGRSGYGSGRPGYGGGRPSRRRSS